MNDIARDLMYLRHYVEQAGQGGLSRLPAEPKLCETLNISRGRLRTLLKHLEDEGLIWRHVGKGTFIGPRQLEPGSPEWMDGISVGAIMDARILLEPQLAAEAAVHATLSDLQALDNCMNAMRTADNYYHWKRLDEKLHRLVAEATHNNVLVLLYDTLRVQLAGLNARLEQQFGSAAPMSKNDFEHEAYVNAISAHDPEAAEQAMRAHLLSVRTGLFGTR